MLTKKYDTENWDITVMYPKWFKTLKKYLIKYSPIKIKITVIRE